MHEHESGREAETIEADGTQASAWASAGESDTVIATLHAGMATAAQETLEQQVARFLEYRGTQPGDVIELQGMFQGERGNFFHAWRTLYAEGSGCLIAAALEGMAAIQGYTGFYYVMNAPHAGVIARDPKESWTLITKGGGTTDGDIIRRCCLFFDFDPTRPSGVSATDEEKERARSMAEGMYVALVTHLGELGAAVGFGDSGNGCHVYLPVDIPPSLRVTEIVKALLSVAGKLFAADGAKVDAAVSDAKRLCPAFGTMKRKGEDTSDRPHRRTTFWAPRSTTRLKLEDLEHLLLTWTLLLPSCPERDTAAKILGLQEKTDNAGKSKMPTASPTQTAAPGSSLFDRVNAVPTREVAERLGLLEGESCRCPGCGELKGVGFTPKANGVKCHHNRCSSQGKDGFRTNVDLTMSAKGLAPLAAAQWLANEFGISTPVSANSALSAGANGDWESPVPFERPRTPARFPVDALPTVLAEWAEAESVETQTPVDLAAFLSIAVCSAAVAKKFTVHVAGQWKEGLNLYVLGALPPGARKSAVFEHATRPLYDYERQLQRQTAPEISKVQVARDIHARERERLLKAASTDESSKVLLAKLSPPPELPAMPRLVADDVTTEALTRVLAEQDGRMAVLSPEGGFFTILGGAYSEKVNIDVILKGWGGENVVVDRVGRPSVTVEGATLTIGLTVQPHVVQEFVSNKVFAERGLTARFLYFLPEDMLGHREIEPPPAPTHLVSAYQDTVRSLLQLSRLRDDGERVSRQELTLSRDAHQELLAFRRELEARIGAGGDLSHMSGWASKLPGALVRIAGIMTLVQDTGSREIDLGTIAHALLIGDYLIEHAQAALGGTVLEVSVADAKHILAWVKRLKLSRFSRRECFTAHRARFRQVQDLEPVLDALVQHHYLRDITAPSAGPGRPSTTYEVNPEFLAQNSQNTQNVCRP